MQNVRAAVIVLFAVTLSGCGASRFSQRQSEIDGAYTRGEISFEQKERMTIELDRDRAEQREAAMQSLQQMSANQQQQQKQSQIIYPKGPSYNVYDQNGNQVGSLRPR